MTGTYRIAPGDIVDQNAKALPALQEDYDALARRLARSGADIETITKAVAGFGVAIPSWGVGTGGTRFARFAGVGEPRNVFDKLEDCATIQKLTRATPTVSLHFPWDKPKDIQATKQLGDELGLGFDAVNSNTFQDQADQKLSYKFGSLCHTDAATRRQAVEHNIECIELGKALGSKALTVWISDGSNFAGQQHFARALERYLESMRAIYAKLPADWLVFIEHKMFEPAFYSTVISDWGTNYWAATQLGDKARCLVDLGHHAPNTNIEQIVARLIQFGKLGGFHFNDSKYGDDDLDAGSVNPFQLFLVFNELVDAADRKALDVAPAYMLDQSHNVTDPVESLMSSAMELQRRYAQACLIDRARLEQAQAENDALMALHTLKAAFNTDVSPILGMARHRSGGAIDPLGVYRWSGYRRHKQNERPAQSKQSAGIV
jgi:L-rhamnose isomerase / sugar isomerase